MFKTGYAVSLLEPNGDHTFTLNIEELEKILLDDEIKNRYAVVVSVCGIFNKGKSFVTDFILRYLDTIYGGKEIEPNWIDKNNSPLDGFNWCGGPDISGRGVLMWSEVFRTKIHGEEVAIILLDAQGPFDCTSTVGEGSTVFAMSTLLSSVQIYNISQNIQEGHLHNLELFAEYGKIVLSNDYATPFQKLYFLVRDWSHPCVYPYGEIGGKKFLERRLSVYDEMDLNLQGIRKNIKTCFSDLACFLLPHHGLAPISDGNFDGQLQLIEPIFIEHLMEFVISVLSPKKLIIKTINGEKVKAKDLVFYFQSYMEVYNSGFIPQPDSLFLATVKASNHVAMARSRDDYEFKMEALFGVDKPSVSIAILRRSHFYLKQQALLQFVQANKMGNENFLENYAKQLDVDLDEIYNKYRTLNQNKDLFKSIRTIIVFNSLILFFISLTAFFYIMGINILHHVCRLCMKASGFSLLIWSGFWFSGQLDMSIPITITSFTEYIWENVIVPIVELLKEMGERVMSNSPRDSD